MDPHTLKTSTIYIAVGDEVKVYRSVDEVPRRLRRKLLESTSSANSATILIADRRGRQELARAVRQRHAVATRRALSARPSPAGITLFLQRWGGVIVTGAVGLMAWLLLTMK